jgi:hypothetical protein
LPRWTAIRFHSLTPSLHSRSEVPHHSPVLCKKRGNDKTTRVRLRCLEASKKSSCTSRLSLFFVPSSAECLSPHQHTQRSTYFTRTHRVSPSDVRTTKRPTIIFRGSPTDMHCIASRAVNTIMCFLSTRRLDSSNTRLAREGLVLSTLIMRLIMRLIMTVMRRMRRWPICWTLD